MDARFETKSPPPAKRGGGLGWGALLVSIVLAGCDPTSPDDPSTPRARDFEEEVPKARVWIEGNTIVPKGEVAELTAMVEGGEAGGPLAFIWSVVESPVAPATPLVLESATSQTVTFNPGSQGRYYIGLEVLQGGGKLARTVVLVTSFSNDPEPTPPPTNPEDPPPPVPPPDENLPPTAHIVAQEEVTAGDVVLLSGDDSADPDASPSLLSFTWTLSRRPEGSTATLSGTAEPQAQLRTDAPGIYGVQLVVSDGLDNAQASVIVLALARVENRPPVANAGPDLTGLTGRDVTLDGTRSFDPDNGPALLELAWTVRAAPSGSTYTFSDDSVPVPLFRGDTAGIYTLRLTVTDGAASAPDDVVVQLTPTNLAPIAVVSPDIRTSAGTRVQVTGSQSYDPDRAPSPLRYSWSVAQAPPASTLLFSSVEPDPWLTPDVVGTFILRLIVNDGALDSTPVTTAIHAEDSGGMFVLDTDTQFLDGATFVGAELSGFDGGGRLTLPIGQGFGDGADGDLVIDGGLECPGGPCTSTAFGATLVTYGTDNPYILPSRAYHFRSITIRNGGVLQAKPFDGLVGGKLLLDSQGTVFVDLESIITASGMGYRGGPVRQSGGTGFQGESILGTGSEYTENNDSGGGGGAGYISGDKCGSTGAGGGHATLGSVGQPCNGSPASLGGAVRGNPRLSPVTMGGGGGAGSDYGNGVAGKGGDGGGIVRIRAPRIIVEGSIQARGLPGDPGTRAHSHISGAGGGGAGGSVWLEAGMLDVTGAVNADGGLGGTGPWPSGRGGVGRVRLDYNNGDATTVPPAYRVCPSGCNEAGSVDVVTVLSGSYQSRDFQIPEASPYARFTNLSATSVRSSGQRVIVRFAAAPTRAGLDDAAPTLVGQDDRLNSPAGFVWGRITVELESSAQATSQVAVERLELGYLR